MSTGILLISIPFAAGLLAFAILSNPFRRLLLLTVAAGHFALTCLLLATGKIPPQNAWIGFDAPGKLFLSLISLLFLAATVYAVSYLKRQASGGEAVFTGCLLLFLGSMTLAAGTRHLGLLWVAMEATTLASAPLIYFHKNHHSLEATWKYLLICSVGIALALLGNLFLALSWPSDGGEFVLSLDRLLAVAPQLNAQWLQAAFIFFLIGYGTKMGLAPMHTWLPDAHSEAPALVSALLSGALLNCALLGILRVHQVMIAAGKAAFSCNLLLVFGLFSILIAAVFIIAQADYKRLLAYSSIEHMGIIAFGIGLGGEAVFGSMLHAVNHSIAKAMLFFLAGNILAVYRTRMVSGVSGVVKIIPVTGWLWLLGFLAISGIPPFGMFVSEFILVKQAAASGNWLALAGLLVLLGAVFAGMGAVFLNTAQGEVPPGIEAKREPVLAILPPLTFCGLALILGLYLPHWFTAALKTVAASFGAC